MEEKPENAHFRGEMRKIWGGTLLAAVVFVLFLCLEYVK